MSAIAHDLTPDVDLGLRRVMGPVRTAHPIYVRHLPPCNKACPAGEDIQGWLDLAQAGRYQEAWAHILRDNPMPGVHGRVCYHPCETGCNRGAVDEPVGIHAVERFLGDRAMAEGWAPPQAAAGERQAGAHRRRRAGRIIGGLSSRAGRPRS